MTYATRADLMQHPDFQHLEVDTSGNPRVWLNRYICTCTGRHGDCESDWTSEWSCQCEDECPVCGTATEPAESDWLPTGDAESEQLWEGLPEAGA